MEQEQILSLMKAYFVQEHGPERGDQIETLRASDLIEDSVDAVTFIMYLEDKIGRDIPMAKIGPGLTSLTIPELAGELCRLLQ